MDKWKIKYILSLLEWQETKLKCINLGCTTNKEIRTEIGLIKECKEFIKSITKEK